MVIAVVFAINTTANRAINYSGHKMMTGRLVLEGIIKI